ncbi:hypothetical protein [Nocardia sp. NBC_01009]|uniref:hypothetical protein n=1 Tax=Nocardia sp. NBC_01009 TaxID=2975996 RepID=UPI00386548D7|nr:hypothetical protein OHA42_17385 [Nocardia sp. NBC_01009]
MSKIRSAITVVGYVITGLVIADLLAAVQRHHVFAAIRGAAATYGGDHAGTAFTDSY